MAGGHVYGLVLVGMLLSTADAMMLRYLMEDKVAQGAMCLDGSPTGIYFRAAAAVENKYDWQIYFEGGGWCYDEMDCWERSKGDLGSSKNWAPTYEMGGLLSPDCSKNPDFCNYNRVVLKYCDGNSFSGNRDAPVVVQGKPLYFRGRRNLDATLETLQLLGLKDAQRILLTGCSAGGLSTYLHADYVNDYIHRIAPNLKVFKAASISGFFLNHRSLYDKTNVYGKQMANIFQLANSTHGLNDACIAANPGSEWKCNMAQYVYPHLKTPVMVLNSALDSFQTNCIYTARLPPLFPNQTGTENGWCGAVPQLQSCQLNPETGCDANGIEEMNQYISDFVSVISEPATFLKPGNGAFISSCHTHCEAQNDDFDNFVINGTSMRQAVGQWWRADVTAAANENNYLPCHYLTGPDVTNRKCNPTCALV